MGLADAAAAVAEVTAAIKSSNNSNNKHKLNENWPKVCCTRVIQIKVQLELMQAESLPFARVQCLLALLLEVFAQRTSKEGEALLRWHPCAPGVIVYQLSLHCPFMSC